MQYLVSISTLIICLLGCSISEDETSLIVAIDNDIEAALFEKLSPGINDVMLLLRTTDLVSCETTSLAYKVTDTGYKFTITLTGITTPANCDHSIEKYLEGSISLNRSSDGFYPLEIQILNSFENVGSLSIGEDIYSLNLEPRKGILITDRYLNKTPKRIIWGYIEGSTSSSLNSYKADFVNLLSDYTSEADLAKGNYSHFEITDDNTITIKDIHATSEVISFYYEYTGAKVTLETITNQFRSDLDAQYFIQVYTGEGDVF